MRTQRHAWAFVPPPRSGMLVAKAVTTSPFPLHLSLRPGLCAMQRATKAVAPPPPVRASSYGGTAAAFQPGAGAGAGAGYPAAKASFGPAANAPKEGSHEFFSPLASIAAAKSGRSAGGAGAGPTPAFDSQLLSPFYGHGAVSVTRSGGIGMSATPAASSTSASAMPSQAATASLPAEPRATPPPAARAVPIAPAAAAPSATAAPAAAIAPPHGKLQSVDDAYEVNDVDPEWQVGWVGGGGGGLGRHNDSYRPSMSHACGTLPACPGPDHMQPSPMRHLAHRPPTRCRRLDLELQRTQAPHRRPRTHPHPVYACSVRQPGRKHAGTRAPPP